MKTNVLRVLALLMSVLLLTVFISACSPSESANPPANENNSADTPDTADPGEDTGDQGGEVPPGKPLEGTEIEIMHSFAESHPVFQEIATKFEQETGIKVNVYESAVATHYTELNERIQTNNVPEIFSVWPGNSVDPYIDSNALAVLTGEPWVERLGFAGAQESVYNGETYIAPFNTSFLTFAYNEEVFARNNLSAPENYAEFVNILETLKNDPEISFPITLTDNYPLMITSILTASFIYQFEPDFDEKVASGEKRFDSPEVYEMYKKVAIDWAEAGYINVDTAPSTTRMGRELMELLDGKTGLIAMGSYDLNVINEMNTENVSLLMIPIPSETNHGALIAAAGNAFAVSGFAEGAEKEAALLFLDYLMNPENNNLICKSMNSLSTFDDVSVDMPDIIKNLEKYRDNPSHGWIVWPPEVQNNLTLLTDVMRLPAGEKEEALKATLAQLHDIWMGTIQ
ncbi:MAG: ABC transporter substrate-binding protein [Oscillospiraceae bacterium]|jgi:raffinose/stachyose/melibiose transport system substrate-binding protein|nr:ABC transporter substrate-binding protein [Oscillospiraceae bacterium]